MQFSLYVLLVPGLARLSLPQGPDNGSPFVDAPLPFDALKAPPGSAFEILMICLGVALLAALATAAFLAVGKLGSLQEQLRREFALRRKETDGLDSAPHPGADGEQAEALLAAVGQLRTSIESGNERMEERLGELRAAIEERSAPAPDAVRSGADMPLMHSDPEALEAMKGLTEALASFHSSAEAQSARLAGQVESLAAALVHLPRESFSMPPGPEPMPGAGTSPASMAIQGARANLSAQGYTQVEIITPPSEIDADLLRAGELTVEAKRGGAIFKGRVLLDEGQVVDVQLRPSHQIFP